MQEEEEGEGSEKVEGVRGRMRAGEGRRDAEEEITGAEKVEAHGRNGAVGRGS